MANPDHVKKLNEGVNDWNEWRKHNDTTPDLSHINLRDANLSGADLSGADLSGADLNDADLRKANLTNAQLISTQLVDVDFSNANLCNANLRNANLKNAQLANAQFLQANLRKANLKGAKILGTNFSYADLRQANFTEATIKSDQPNEADGVIFSNSIIQETNFTDATLNNANFTKAKAGLSILGYRNFGVLALSTVIGIWSAFPASIMLTFYMYFLEFCQKKLNLIFFFSAIISIFSAICIRLNLGGAEENIFTSIHIAIGLGMISITAFSEILAIKLNRSKKQFTATFILTLVIVFIIILTIFYLKEILGSFEIYDNIQKFEGMTELDRKAHLYKAILGAVVGAIYGLCISHSAINGRHFDWLWRSYVENFIPLATLFKGGTSFKGATLNDANFNSSSLASANFIGASINGTSWQHVENLDCAICGETYLQHSQIRQIFQSSAGKKIKSTDFKGLVLAGINFAGKDLSDANFTKTDLSHSNLSGAILVNANLEAATLNSANLTNANLTGAYLKDFNYDEKTIFRDVICKHLNLGNSNHNIDLRLSLPVRHLQSGDFDNFFKREEYAKLLIRNTDNLKAINSALSRIIKEYKIEPNSLRGIRRIGNYILVEFKVPENSNKFVIEQDFENTVENSENNHDSE